MAQPDGKVSADDRQAFTDAYRFFERHHDMPNTVEAWEECSDDLKRTVEGYQDNCLVSALLTALYDVIDRRLKDRKMGKEE